ncbi:MAG: glycosyltransferase [Opitutaceae bacterium]|nr:glycosyltransferase [Opitutaceae bacterium]
MNRRKILIFTASPLCRNPRVVKEATTLGSNGYDTIVLTVAFSDRFEQIDRELIAPLPFRRVVLDCLGRGPASRIRRFRVRSITWLARALLHYLRVETAAALGPARSLLAMARAIPADLTILHTEIPLWAARPLVGRGRRVAVDFEDWYSEDLLESDRRARPRRLLRKDEAFALHRAAYTTATSESMAAALAAAHGGMRPIVVRNVFPLQPRSRLERPQGNEPPSIAWFSQTIGPGRGLESFFAAWSRSQRPSQVFLLGDERPGYREQLLTSVPPDRRSRILFQPFVAPDKLPEVLAGFDIGLALEPTSPPNRDVTISNKIFQYMNAGLAVIATSTAGQREVLATAPGCGLLVEKDDPAQFASQLDTLLGNTERLRACQNAARAAAATELCWEKESARFLQAVAEALNV